jgi:hypothetical protein
MMAPISQRRFKSPFLLPKGGEEIPLKASWQASEAIPANSANPKKVSEFKSL